LRRVVAGPAYPYLVAVGFEGHLVTGPDPKLIPYLLRNHDLPLDADLVSHTGSITVALTMPAGEKRLRISMLSLCLIGLGIATYIAIVESGGGAPVCVAGGGCETVAQSEYAEILGVNVALLGIGGYLGLLAATLLGGDRGRIAGLVLAMIGFGFSLYLTYLELFVIDAICQWCVGSAVAMTGLLALAIARALLYLGTPNAGWRGGPGRSEIEGSEHG
jgi:uncharacterized membrane protein